MGMFNKIMGLFFRKRSNSTSSYKKKATVGDYTIGIRSDKSVEVLVDGKPFTGNVKGLLRDEIAPMMQLDIDPEWNTQQLGKKIIDNINEFNETISKYDEKSDQLRKMLEKRLEGLLQTAKRRGVKELGWTKPLPNDGDDQGWDDFNNYGADYGVWLDYWNDRLEMWKGFKFLLDGDKLICTLAQYEDEELFDDVYLEYSPRAQNIDSLETMVSMIEMSLTTKR